MSIEQTTTLKQKEKIKTLIQEKYLKSNTFNQFIGNPHYKSIAELPKVLPPKLKGNTIKYDTIYFKIPLYILIFLLVVQLITKPDYLLGFNKNIIFFLAIQLSAIGLLYYAAYIKKYEKHAITFDEIGIHFCEYSYTNYGLKYKRKYIKWDDILEIGILTIPRKKTETRYSVIIGTKTLEIAKMDVTHMEVLPQDCMALINEKLRLFSRC